MNTHEVDVSVVLPCLNEEEGLGPCLEKINQVFKSGHIKGEIIVSDNGSTDRSVDIARSHNARIVFERQKGYGAAYLKGLGAARGKYIVIGDSDNSYDFYDIPKFLEPLYNGYDFCIGSRFKGSIHKGAMPWTHRYIGNPILSFMTRLFFRTRLSDIHCGMRSFTSKAFFRMRLMTLGMEFATEMVVSAMTNHLKIREVPINYYSRKGKSKLRAMFDAWRHVRFMLLYCPIWLYVVPGGSGFILGIALLLVSLRGPFLFLGHQWDTHLVVFSSIISILSYQILNLGVCAHTYAIRQGFVRYDPFTLFFKRNFNLERGIVIGGIIFFVGLAINLFIVVEWAHRRFGSLYRLRESILALTLLTLGLQTIFSSFFISLLFLRRRRRFY